MHWINLSEKAGMKFLRFCSPTTHSVCEKVSRGSSRQVVRHSIGDGYTHSHSQVGVVGRKSTHIDDTPLALALCDEVSWLRGGLCNSLDKSRPAYDIAYDLAIVKSFIHHRAEVNANATAERTRSTTRTHERRTQRRGVSGVGCRVGVSVGETHAEPTRERTTYTRHTHTQDREDTRDERR